LVLAHDCSKEDNMKHLNRFILVGTLLAVLVSPVVQTAHAADGGTGTVVAWGCQNGFDYGQCAVPAGLSGVAAIAAGYAHSLTLKSDGTVVAWGCQNGQDYGQCAIPAGLSGATAIAAGLFHSLALKSDGTVIAWGCGPGTDFGQCTVPAGLSGVTAISAGYAHSLALKGDGTVVVWGCQSGGDFGQCAVPAGLSGVTAISAGGTQSLALKSDGTVVAWGCGQPFAYGQCTIPAGLSGVTAIAAGFYHSLPLVGTAGPTLHVAGIVPRFVSRTTGYTVQSRITIQDANDAPVAGAVVTATVTLPNGFEQITRVATTNATGVATVSVNRPRAGTYTFTVASVSAADFSYDPSANVVTSATVTIP
jgi:hypothetical protein